MAATRKGAISFGLVHIPVDLHTAIQDNDIHFNQLCKKDGSRVKYKIACANGSFKKSSIVAPSGTPISKTKTLDHNVVQRFILVETIGIEPTTS